jgi:hypothetical protein
MGVETKGWTGGEGSLADAMYDQMDGGDNVAYGRADLGPLADLPQGVDPAYAHSRQVEEFDKEARVLGYDNSFESTTTPGGNRVVQNDPAGAAIPQIHQTPEAARSGAEGDTKKDSSPTKGSKGSEIMSRIRARKAEKGDVVGEETATRSVGGKAQDPGHNLFVKDPAPVPKEMTPTRKGNLADQDQKSAWTGSGPQAALHEEYSKVGAVDFEDVIELFKTAGVPPCEIEEDSILYQLAVGAAGFVKTASGPEYLARFDVHPLKLVAELDDTLGDQWVEWEPETIRESIIKQAGVEPSDDVMSKIMAVKVVSRRPDMFFDDWHAMEKIAVALNDQAPIMGAVEDVPVEWLSNAVSIVTKLAGVNDFGPETSKYVAARLYDQGYVVAPPLLKFADQLLGERVGNDDLRKKVILAYARSLNASDLDEGEDVVSIQVARMLRNHAYVLDRLDESRGQLA